MFCPWHGTDLVLSLRLWIGLCPGSTVSRSFLRRRSLSEPSKPCVVTWSSRPGLRKRISRYSWTISSWGVSCPRRDSFLPPPPGQFQGLSQGLPCPWVLSCLCPLPQVLSQSRPSYSRPSLIHPQVLWFCCWILYRSWWRFPPRPVTSPLSLTRGVPRRLADSPRSPRRPTTTPP